ncbi:MAG: T9SS type A sorting domain-containing protein [Crocinitomicaceae bacterium]|nr:T9SS type A sorting domain-containing protein [Crocinitomicaceae bacterium]
MVTGNNDLSFDSKESFIEVYPNPAGSDVKINSSDPLEEVKIYDASGRVVGSWKDIGLYVEIPMTKMADGIYVVKAKSSSTMVEIKLVHINE